MATYRNSSGDVVRQLPDGTTVNLENGRVEVLGDAWRQDLDLLMGTITADAAILRAVLRAQVEAGCAQ